jgi:hypothetical protein|nr:MAG TPA: hypothetical protein [Caudoviricetes sp.]
MGKIYEVYERNGIVYFLNENKEIEFYRMPDTLTMKIETETNNGKIMNVVDNLKDGITIFSKDGIELLEMLGLFHMAENLFKRDEKDE